MECLIRVCWGKPMAETGHYYKKQIECKSSIISWSHRSRFTMAVQLLGAAPAERLLDYGCGDGTFLTLVADRIKEGIGTDVAEEQIRDCAIRQASFTNLRFCLVNQLADPAYDGAFAAVVCMETLEHCTEPAVEKVLADLSRLCRPNGRIVISVPIETGLPFLFKKAIRTAAAWRGLSDYKYYEKYTFGNALRMITAGKRMKIPRPVYGEPGMQNHSHYGFNWRAMRERIRTVLCLERTRFSPLGWLGGIVSSQAWFVCRPRTSENAHAN
jgi:SAM-dependent methyltransferase